MDCEFALNEGGWVIQGRSRQGAVHQYFQRLTRVPVSLTLTARGTVDAFVYAAGRDNAIFTLAKAMAKIADYDTQPKLIPSTKEFFNTPGPNH